MRLFWKKSKPKKSTVTFATSCWEKDWEKILLHSDYLAKQQIANHCYEFDQKILMINNVKDPFKVESFAKKKIDDKILTHSYLVEKNAQNVLDFFGLQRSFFRAGSDAHLYDGVDNDWIYYNAIGVLSALYLCKTDYLLYMTGDSFLSQPVEWIDKAILRMQQKRCYKVANLTWNEKYEEAQKASAKLEKDFFVAKEGFSDQCFLMARKDFQKPIYNEMREDSAHFPRGDVFEKRVFCYMVNHGWHRITYRHGSYHHENI